MPVGVERVHARKLVKPSGRAHDTDSAGDGPLAFVRTNGGRREMQRRQRRSTRGVDTDGWADEAQAVRDSARGTQLSAADDTHSAVRVDFTDWRPVFVRGDADETTGFRSVDCSRIEPGVFQRLPRDPHGYPLLRIHRHGLTLRDAVESGVESACVGDESAGIGNAAPAVQVRQR
ncbi:Uncharacterised protein [Mycobacteroides abscessus subsp. abscessus]|nr:Uncharacterised protein [Mycobacteroides abscessus subsp. abscessus]